VSSLRPHVFLFDIDGTLVLTGGAGRRAFTRAFAEATGRDDAVHGFSFGGMTDLAIVRQALEGVGLPFERALVDRVLERYLVYLVDEVRLTPSYEVMPFARETVALLRGEAGCAVGLGTGNLERGAQIKLARGGLFSLFDFGGFGSDHEQREELLRAGAERGARRLGIPVDECRVVVIGDTVRDVIAAHAISAECLAVMTSGVSEETLRAAGAEYVVSDLGARGVLDMLLAR
jgi:phosphoglycolate phosphatase-like HAD superfamily hydrolase